MKRWFALTCPVCGFRYPPSKFTSAMYPILYPIQLVTGGGRAKGFSVLKYLPWSTLPALKQTDVWNSLLSLYSRLGAAYDNFYEVLGLLSPKMKTLLQGLRHSYEDSYRIEPSRYSMLYSRSLPDITEPYHVNSDYPEAYEALLIPIAM